MPVCRYPIGILLPHEPPMILLDQVLSSEGTSLTTALTIRENSLFVEAGGVPAHVGIEYMAQPAAPMPG